MREWEGRTRRVEIKGKARRFFGEEWSLGTGHVRRRNKKLSTVYTCSIPFSLSLFAGVLPLDALKNFLRFPRPPTIRPDASTRCFNIASNSQRIALSIEETGAENDQRVIYRLSKNLAEDISNKFLRKRDPLVSLRYDKRWEFQNSSETIDDGARIRNGNALLRNKKLS